MALLTKYNLFHLMYFNNCTIRSIDLLSILYYAYFNSIGNRAFIITFLFLVKTAICDRSIMARPKLELKMLK